MKQQNISNFKLECSKDLVMKFGEYRSNFTLKPFLSIRSRGRVAETPPVSPPLSKDKKLRKIGHSMSIGNLILGVNSATVSYLIHYDSLSQCGSCFIIKCDTSLLYKMRSVFYYKTCQVFITKCILRQFCYKIIQFLQIVTIVLQNATIITKCDV